MLGQPLRQVVAQRPAQQNSRQRPSAAAGSVQRAPRSGGRLAAGGGAPGSAPAPARRVPAELLPESPSPTDGHAAAPSSTDGNGSGSESEWETALVVGSGFGSVALQTLEGSSSAAVRPAKRAPSPTRHESGRGPHILVAKPLPRVLLLHCGGTLGMDAGASYQEDPEGHLVLREGTGGCYLKTSEAALRPPAMLSNLLAMVPELKRFAQLEVKVVMNKARFLSADSSNMGPKDWQQLAKVLDANRDCYDAFLIVHGTDTMAFTASALSLMLVGFKRVPCGGRAGGGGGGAAGGRERLRPIVLTGSQLPLAMPRSDARQNLLDAITVATAGFAPPHISLGEVAVCFGGKLMRGNRVQKINTSDYMAFDSPSFPPLARLGIDVDWREELLLKHRGAYTPRFKLTPNVIRIPIVPGSDPRLCYGDLAGRGVRGVVLEAFGTANMPNEAATGWLSWLRGQRRKGLVVHLSSQCSVGPLRPELYRSGTAALAMGVSSGPQMTPECSLVKLMPPTPTPPHPTPRLKLTLSYPDILMGMELAGEM
eukprot:scaffold10.g2278.t1